MGDLGGWRVEGKRKTAGCPQLIGGLDPPPPEGVALTKTLGTKLVGWAIDVTDTATKKIIL